MEVNLERSSLPQCSLVRRSTYKLVQLGRIALYLGATEFKLMCDGLESTDRLKQRLNLENGMDTIGGWTGTYYRKVTDGRMPLWAGSPQQTFFREPISTSNRKKTLFISLRSRDMSILCKNQTRGG